jgi:hypothetical protein
MGIGMVLLAAAIVGAIIAAVAGSTLGIATFLLTRRASSGRWLVLLAACIFPFASLVWGGFISGLQALVNERVFHRDAGLGDTWECPLPNGYSILMIDTTENGWVFNPKTQPGGGVGEQEDAISGIQQLQLLGPFVLGNRNDEWGVGNPGQNVKVSYFILDTSKGAHTTYANENDFRDAANRLGVNAIRLEPIDVVYGRYRPTWFDAFAGFLFFVPPLVGFVGLVIWVMRVRKRSRSTNQPRLPEDKAASSCRAP